jgi:opacity protein-like surface antigen
MKKLIATSVAALLAAAALPAAADDWTGGYVGAFIGTQSDPDDNDDRVLFDTNLDGSFGDTVNTAAAVNAFSPGFCDGVAQDRTPAAGCADNSGGGDYGLRAGYDWDMDGFVWGVVGEWSLNDSRDGVSAFSTTPARYALLRKVDDVLALRLRAGFALGDGEDGLLYATAGYAQANVENFFFTSNAANAFTTSGDSDAAGWQAGVGYEHKFWDDFTLGLEYLYTSLDDDEFRVHVAPGTAAATNPFLIVNPAGTDFARSDDEIELSSLRLTGTWRF